MAKYKRTDKFDVDNINDYQGLGYMAWAKLMRGKEVELENEPSELIEIGMIEAVTSKAKTKANKE